MKQFLTSLGLGLLLLGTIVAFALLPGPASDATGPEESAPDPAVAAAQQAGCREFAVGIAASSLDEALANIGVALDLEREGGDGSGYFDWLDAELVTTALDDVAGIAGDVARTPQLPQEVYLPLREVVRRATALERSAVSGTIFVAGKVDDDREALAAAVVDVEQACA